MSHDLGGKLSVLEVYGAVGESGQLLVVGDDDESLAEAVAEVEEELVQFLLVLGVERTGRLVGQDDGRAVDEGAGHSDALLLAARQFGGLVRGAVAESHELQQFLGPFLGFLLRGAGDVGRNHDVLQSRELGEQLVELEDEAQVAVAEVGKGLLAEGGGVDTIDTYRTRVGAVEGADDLQQGGLSGAGRAYDADYLATVDVEVDAF